MTDDSIKKCKNNDCDNPVLDGGDYCNLCSQKRKENRNKNLGIGGSILAFAGTVGTALYKSGAIKKISKLTLSAAKYVLKK